MGQARAVYNKSDVPESIPGSAVAASFVAVAASFVEHPCPLSAYVQPRNMEAFE